MDLSTCISAALKHLDDSDHLLSATRFDNAAYLSGYVVECGLKSLLLAPGMPAAKQLGHDLRLMAGNALHLAAALSPARKRYSIPSSRHMAALIQTWRADERYARKGTVDRNLAESRVQAAHEAASALIYPRLLDGKA